MIAKKIRLQEANFLAILSLIMIFGSLVYFVYRFDWTGMIITLIMSAGAYYFISPYLTAPSQAPLTKEKFTKIDWLLLALFILSNLWALFILVSHRSDRALISPWEALPSWIFAAYILAAFSLIIIFLRAKRPGLNRWLLSWHYGLSFIIAAIVYKIGYGFDPFIHQASMEFINQHGFIAPKTPYYLGEYSLLITIHRFTGFSLYILNKFLVPITAAIFLPGALNALGKTQGRQASFLLAGLLVLIFSFSFLIVSTPQNLSFIFLLLSLFYSLAGNRRLLSFLLALAAMAIHPISGLPALSFFAFRELNYRRPHWTEKNYRKYKTLVFAGSLLSLPIAFAIISGQSLLKLRFSLQAFTTLSFWPVYEGNLGSFALNFSYLLTYLAPPLFFGLLIYGAWRWRNFDNENIALRQTISALMIAWLLTASLSFDFLIDYEQGDYLGRLIIMMALYALPWVIYGLSLISFRARLQSRNGKIIFALAGALLIGASFYLSYPRQDVFFNSRGYSVSQADLDAVRLIEQDAQGKPYVVLANQQTSVAALKELGFDHYYQTSQGPVFFYPIPTGGPLYQHYLTMVNEGPTPETIRQALDLTGAKQLYFAVSRYWHRSDRLIGEAKTQAAASWTVGDGEIDIFSFDN